MDIIVADSSSLIILEKCRLLQALTTQFPIIIPEAVYTEVVNKDTLERYPDAKKISTLVSEKRLRVVKVTRPAQTIPFTLGKGETEALHLVKQTKDAILATDDGKAIKACRYLGVRFIISPRIAAELYRLDVIDFADARSAVEKMKIVGRYSADIISEAILDLEVIRDAKTDDRKGSR